MAKNLLSFAGVALLFSMTLTSCGGDDNDTPAPAQTTEQKLIGTWKETFAAADNNGNEVLDESEKIPEGAQYDTRLTFQANGVMTFISKTNGVVSSADTGTWNLVGSNYIRFILAGDTTSAILHTLNSTSLVLQDTFYVTTEWTGYTKL